MLYLPLMCSLRLRGGAGRDAQISGPRGRRAAPRLGQEESHGSLAAAYPGHARRGLLRLVREYVTPDKEVEDDDIADDLAEHGAALSLKERMAEVCGTMACHGSVRAGRHGFLTVTDQHASAMRVGK